MPALYRRIDLTADVLRQLAYREPADFPVLLDSAAPGRLGRHSILAAYPLGALWLDGLGRLHSDGLGALPAQSGFIPALQELLQREARAQDGPSPSHTVPAGAAGPFQGGWMLFLSYEMAAEFEPQLDLPCAVSSSHIAGEAPSALALRVAAAVSFDHASGESWLIAEEGRGDLLERLEARIRRLPSPADALARLQSLPLPAVTLDEDPPERYRWCVERALDHIRAGDVYQANLARGWRGEWDETASEELTARLYERLRRANPAPFAALAQHRGWALLSSSPERLLRSARRRVETRPIAGTRPRSRNPGADSRELAALIANPKERAEHVMLVDLARNDLGRVCEGGSVQVEEMLGTESYAHVHHIVSSIVGRLRADVTPLHLLRAVFPGGTITGCPKFRCMQIIAQLEGQARGAYTGSIGYLNHDGSMDFNILIRSFTLIGRHLELRAGAGIVADSQWERELAETRAKARGLLAALETAPAASVP
ncbi:MAG TPA: aminodeoxychorismate synthase component I [Steroidobacteraceae bacterium]|nr:aminodeoxychorismate synthase component I [Steroidobacteraceae bacterium]